MTKDIATDKTALHGEAIPRTVQRLGRYTLQQRLGVGGMAEVYLAEQDGPQQFKKRVVIKRILPSLAAHAGFVAMFVREAQVAARLTHTHVVQVYELGEQQNNDGTVEYFIAMEYINGLTLQRLATASWLAGSAVPVPVVLRTCADAARGLHAAHTLTNDDGNSLALVHRDISPDNLMVSRDGVTKVLDFGIAKGDATGDGVPQTMVGQLRGKAQYMSPEHINGLTLDGRADLWALGVSMYWLLCGARPFDRNSDYHTMAAILSDAPKPPRQLNPAIPLALEELILALLNKDRLQRPASGMEVAEQLEQLTPPNSNAGRTPTVAFVERFLTLGGSGGNPLSDAGPGESSAHATEAANPPSRPAAAVLRVNVQAFPLAALPPADEPSPAATPAAPGPAQAATPAVQAINSAPSPPRVQNHPVIDMLSRPQQRSALPALLAIALVMLLLGGGALILFRWVQSWPSATGDAVGAHAGSPLVATPVSAADAGFVQVMLDAGFIAVYADAGPQLVAIVDAGEVRGAASKQPKKSPRIVEARVASPEASLWVINARGPKRIEWRGDDGALFGNGSMPLSLPKGTQAIVAVDRLRRLDVKMPVRLGQVLDYESLPSGTLQPKQRERVKIFIGRELIFGDAPVKVTEGTYEIRVTLGAKILSKKSIEFNAGKTIVVDASKP